MSSHPKGEMNERNYVKCDQCRRDRKKCVPRQRKWDQGEKCDRCRATNHSCGPPKQRKPGRRAQKLKAQPRGLQNTPSREPVLREVHDETSGSSHILTPASDSSNEHEAADAGQIRPDQLIGGIIVTQRLLLAVTSDCNKLGESSLLSHALAEMKTQLFDCQARLYAKGQELLDESVEAGDGSATDNTIAHLLLCQLEEQCYAASTRQAKPNHFIIQEDFSSKTWTAIDRHLPGLGGVLSCVAYIPLTGSLPPRAFPRRDLNLPLEERLDRYRHAASLTKQALDILCTDVLSTQHQDDLDESQVWFRGKGFPAAHIAFMNGDVDAALSLSADGTDQPQEKDVLGRSLAHLAVVAEDLNFLRSLSKTDTLSLNVEKDRLGLSLEGTAATMNEYTTFVVLQSLLGLRSIDYTVLERAVVAGNLQIVSHILSSRLGRPPYTHHVQQALTHGYPQIAELFISHLTYDFHTSDDIDRLEKVARDHNCDTIAAQLNNIGLVRASSFDALEDINNINNFIQPYIQVHHVNGAERWNV